MKTINLLEEKNKNNIALKVLNSYDLKTDLLKDNVDKFSLEAIKTLQKFISDKNNNSFKIPKLPLKGISKSQSFNILSIKNYKESFNQVSKDKQNTNPIIFVEYNNKHNLSHNENRNINKINLINTQSRNKNTINNNDKKSFITVESKQTFDKRTQLNRNNDLSKLKKISYDINDNRFFTNSAKKLDNRINFIQNNIIKAKINLNDNFINKYI